MTTASLIPLQPQSQQLQITIGSVPYNLIVQWNAPNASWMMDILDQDNNQILSGVPLITGADLLEQFEYLMIGGAIDAGEMQVQTTSDTFAVPTYANLGTDGNLYWVTEP